MGSQIARQFVWIGVRPRSRRGKPVATSTPPRVILSTLRHSGDTMPAPQVAELHLGQSCIWDSCDVDNAMRHCVDATPLL
eukprot:CAMPEP_0174936098 /NCGR_PEP_ID=MMETSP1355-20121228/56249_1 /TAXON_ID=464990 /ORGANISM="Hemiselmis tepida, Strain CCMP443" /LENGTH=79 /DNA_ID=CAMNT_0016182857 /DNA_START=87 /DNA_END=326 /DNA_ORIENTATION=+